MAGRHLEAMGPQGTDPEGLTQAPRSDRLRMGAGAGPRPGPASGLQTLMEAPRREGPRCVRSGRAPPGSMNAPCPPGPRGRNVRPVIRDALHPLGTRDPRSARVGAAAHHRPLCDRGACQGCPDSKEMGCFRSPLGTDDVEHSPPSPRGCACLPGVT